jgi:hypothetical protein
MGLKFRRGSTAQQSGSLAFGEPYVNTTLGTLVVGGASGDIVLSSAGTGSTGNFGAISGSGLDITGNANIAGNLTLGGAITIGDATADTVNVVASLSSSLIPQTTNAFDLGSATKIWKDLYISTGSIKFVAGTTVVKELSLATLTSLEAATGSSNVSITNLNTTTASLNTSVSNLNTTTASLNTSVSNLNTTTASLLIETANLETFSSSALTRLDNLEGKDISITLTGDVTGTGTITNLANVSFATTIAANSVALGTDTTGDYVGTITGGTGVTSTGATSGEGISHTISIGQAVATSSNVQFNSLGIGMAASATAGRIDATNDVVAFSSSDIRFKENIVPIENALDKISKISGNTYDWKAENKVEHGYEGNDVGVIAQEIEAVLPQLVQTRESGFKAVKYDKLVALLIEGIKEQQQNIDNLTIQVEELKKQKGL